MFYRVFTYHFTDDPLTRKRERDYESAGASQPEGIQDIRAGADGSWGGGGGSIRLRDTNDFVDLSTVTNRIHRYKEYERLRGMAEIESAMTVFADETCFAGFTPVMTPTYGAKTLKWLAENLANERFLVYCYDHDKKDYTLGWAHSPRKTKRAKTVKVCLDNGQSFVCTPDHKILMFDGTWCPAGQLHQGEELMPFYKIDPHQEYMNTKANQYPRIYTRSKGWIHERQFINEWTTGKEDPKLQIVNKYCRMLAEGLSARQIQSITHNDYQTVTDRMRKAGFSVKEMRHLGKKSDRRYIIDISEHDEMDVYDLTVEKYENFATEWGIAHNCQKDDDGRVFKVNVKNEEIKEELEFLMFHRTMLNLDQKKMWNIAKQTFINGDFFFEIVINPDNPKQGVMNLMPLPVDSMYRIETTKGKLVEFQQSKEGPDYQSLARVEVTQATEADLQQATAIRFAPEQIIHIRIGDDRKTFYPYGVSLMEAARGPAHQLRLMEDAMVVYRLTRAPERRVFYVDVQSLPHHKAEAFIERMKDQFKKKKVPSNRGLPGASMVEERWHAPAADEDYWIPIRPNANTRVETLPGAQNLGEVDDVVFFRNKLFTALNFPKNYFNNEDVQSTRITLSAQDVKFARMIERLQSHLEDAMWEICDRHLKLLGYPEDCYEDLYIQMTPPSDWRELTRAEVLTNRITNATALQGAGIMSNFDILVEFMKYPEEVVQKMLGRLKLQQLEQLRMQIIASNPNLVGVGLPGPDEKEIGAEPGGPNPMLGDDPTGAPPAGDPMGGAPMGNEPMGGGPGGPPPMAGTGMEIPDASDEDIKKYDLEIKDYAKEMDREEVDRSEL